MSRTRKLRIGMAGTGAISQNHLIGWGKLQNAEVVALCDPNVERAAERARQFGIANIYPRLTEMLAAEHLDAIDIATPRETHADLVLECADRAVPVLCQKPFAPTYAEAKSLIDKIGGRIRVMVHENWRFRPFYRRIAQLCADGTVGDIKQCIISAHRSGLIPAPDGSMPALVRQPMMRTERRLMIAETLIHHIDVVRWLLGPLHLCAVVASRGSADVVGEDSATLLLSGPNDTSVVVTGSVHVAGFDPRAGDRFVLLGTKNSLIYENGILSVRGDGAFEERFDEAYAYQASFDQAVAHFVNALASGAPFETPPEDNIHVLKLVEDAYAFLATRPNKGKSHGPHHLSREP